MEKYHFVPEPPRLAHVVSDHDDLRSGRVHGTDNALDLVRCAGVEARRRLVEKQDLGVERPRAGECQSLLLAAGEHPRGVVCVRFESDVRQHVKRAHATHGLRQARAFERIDDVGQCRASQQHRPLEHHRLPAWRMQRVRRVPDDMT